MRIVVTGGRDYWDKSHVFRVLDEVSAGKEVLLAHGDCSGADSIADEWAQKNGAFVAKFAVYDATWKRVGGKAGPIRNNTMLSVIKPDLVVAFPGGKGTNGCVERAKELGVPVRDMRDADG